MTQAEKEAMQGDMDELGDKVDNIQKQIKSIHLLIKDMPKKGAEGDPPGDKPPAPDGS